MAEGLFAMVGWAERPGAAPAWVAGSRLGGQTRRRLHEREDKSFA